MYSTLFTLFTFTPITALCLLPVILVLVVALDTFTFNLTSHLCPSYLCLSWGFPQLWWHPSHISPIYHVPILYILCTSIPFWLSQTLVEPMLWCCQQISLPNKAAKRKVRGSTCICTHIHTYVFAFVCMCMIVLSNRLQIA